MSWSGGFDEFSGVIPTTSSKKKYGQTGGASTRYGATGNDDGRMRIGELIPGTSSTKIVGIVITREEPRRIPNKKDPTAVRYVLSFTIRDSPTDFINVTCWGSEGHIFDLSNLFHIGEVLELNQVYIQTKPQDGSDEKFRPWTPSPCTLSVGENKGTLQLCTDWNIDDYALLMHIPIKAANDYYTIGDITANGQSLHGQSINILAAVKSVGSPTEVTTKHGKKVTRCEVKLFDETAPNLTIVLWDKELIHFAEGWTPREHVLFAIDVRATYNDFRKCMVATATSKTIITVNPDTREAHRLYQYAQTVDVDDITAMDTTMDGSFVDVATIQDVYTIDQIKARQAARTDEGGTIHGMCYVCITTMDIDGSTSNVIAIRCSKCRYRVDSVAGVCMNQNCPQGTSIELDADSTETDVVYDLRMAVSDHTGTLSACRVVPETVSKMIGCPPLDFIQLTDDQRTEIKWKFLLERCKVYFKLNLPTPERPLSIPRIIACEKADPLEVARHLQ